MAVRIDDDVIITGVLSAIFSLTDADLSAIAAINRSKLKQDVLQPFPVPLTDFRQSGAFAVNLAATSSGSDLALVGGTFGTAAPMIETSDLKAAGATTRYARVLISLPVEYDTGETVNLRIRAGMITTVADVTATVDVEAYRCDESGAVGSDLCTTSAQSINNLTKANKDFTINPATLAPGDRLDVRITIAVNDAATATAVIAAISRVALLCDIKG